jgi:signal peptidase I
MNSSSIFQSLVNEYAGYTFLVGFLLIIGSLGAARLFAKANQPWVAAFIPVWNVAIVLKMVGRPVSHLAFFLVPFYNVYFFFRLCVELAQSFGKYSIIDYVLVSVFNVFYVLNLALAYNEEYQGPVYGVDRSHHGESGVLAAH